MMRRSGEIDLCQMSTIMFTEAVPNETEHDLRTYQIVYRMALRATVTEQHCKRQSLNGIMRDRSDNYREMMTEHSYQDYGRMTPKWD